MAKMLLLLFMMNVESKVIEAHLRSISLKSMKDSEILMDLVIKNIYIDTIERVSKMIASYIIGYKNWDDISTSHFNWKG